MNHLSSNIDRFVIPLRVINFMIGLAAMVTLHLVRLTSDGVGILYDFQFFSTQTNYFVVLWLGLFLLWRNDEDKLDSLDGFLKGALTVYITIVSLVYMILIAPTHNPEGLLSLTNVVHHYIVPALFLLDFFLSQNKEYNLKWLGYWLIYPIFYLVFALFLGFQTGEYVYFFLNIPALGLSGFLLWFTVMMGLFLLFGLLYIKINHYLID